MMNQKASELGAHSSHFANPNGLPAAQYSTASDMAKIAMAVYKNPTLRSIIATKYYSFRYNNGDSVLLKNSNYTMDNNFFCNGMKTGYTNKSKNCLITSGCYQGHDAITVILGTPDRKKLFTDSAHLLGWALNIPTVTQAVHYVKNQTHSSPTRSPKRHFRRKHSKQIASIYTRHE